MKRSAAGKLIMKFAGSTIRIVLDIIFYIVVLVVMLRAVKYAYDFTYQIFGSVSVAEAPGTDVEFEISKGESTMEIATRLENMQLIKNKRTFYFRTRLKEYNIIPGTYILNTSMDYETILEIITSSDGAISEDGEGVLDKNTEGEDSSKEEVTDEASDETSDGDSGDETSGEEKSKEEKKGE